MSAPNVGCAIIVLVGCPWASARPRKFRYSPFLSKEFDHQQRLYTPPHPSIFLWENWRLTSSPRLSRSDGQPRITLQRHLLDGSLAAPVDGRQVRSALEQWFHDRDMIFTGCCIYSVRPSELRARGVCAGQQVGPLSTRYSRKSVCPGTAAEYTGDRPISPVPSVLSLHRLCVY